ncbi:MAG TPA: PilZ domain-containing protein [Phycisphaerae bacterium]|nr:PilZ domain-containing protein [Phycisphaerae bacterium]HRR83417.1 PilZ domain-containing protein [Phycisphaerae bacterium]
MPTGEIVKLTRKQIARLIRKRMETAGQRYDGAELRRAPRWPFPGTVELRYATGDNNQQWFAVCRDISEGGMGVKTDTYFPPDALLDISVHLPEQTFYGQAKVRYCKEMDGEAEYLMGIQFVFDD